MDSKCFFCNPEGMAVIYEDETCLAVLESVQSVKGYTLLIFKPHYETFMDENIPNLNYFWGIAAKLGRAIKTGLNADNVYVASLCDGIKHFHIHLIPRYPWGENDKNRFRDLFTERDGEEMVSNCIQNGRLGGFWWIADAERLYTRTPFAQKSLEVQQQILKEISSIIKRELQ